jgi:predicted GIY-YIG superfamily endonuclease
VRNGRRIMSRKRDTYRYVLRDGRDIVQYGISNDPEARVGEHADDRKRFTTMSVVGPVVTRESALQWERTRIEEYCRTHAGKKPRYNKV